MGDSMTHAGVLGMKWGRRKQRQSVGPDSSSDHATAVSLRKKRTHTLTNDDLKKLTTRLQLEKQYKDLMKDDISPDRKLIQDILTGAFKQVAIKFVASGLESGGGMIIEALRKRYA